MTPNPNFKGTSLFDVEYLRNDTRYTHGYYRPLIQSNMWPIELCHRQRPWSTFMVILAIFIWKLVAYFSGLCLSPSDLTHDGIADDLEILLKVISDYVISSDLEWSHVFYNGRMSYARSNYFYCRVQPEGLLYDAERDLSATAKFLVIAAYNHADNAHRLRTKIASIQRPVADVHDVHDNSRVKRDGLTLTTYNTSRWSSSSCIEDVVWKRQSLWAVGE